MAQRLNKTFLSRKPSSWSFLTGFIGLGILALFFGADSNTFAASGKLVFQEKQYWRLFTTTLLHADLEHLAHNAFFFAGLSALLTHYFGIFVFPVLSLFAGALINFITLKFYAPEVTLVGISGVIYFMASFWLTLYLFIERRQKLWIRFLHAVAVSLIFLFPQAFEQHTSYLAHGLGYAFGIPTGVLYYLIFRKMIRAKDEWIEVNRDPDEFMFPEPSPSHQDEPSEAALSGISSGCAQCPQH